MEFVRMIETTEVLIQALDVRGWSDLNHLVPDANTDRIVLEATHANTRKTIQTN